MNLSMMYTRFERIVAGVLLAGMVVVILLATFSFLRTTGTTVLEWRGDLAYGTFQTLFDRVLAAIIALELAHSVHMMVKGKHGFTQVKTVLLIGVLAIVRKLILLEVSGTSGLFLLGLGGAILALGVVFALVHYVEMRESEKALPSPGAEDPSEIRKRTGEDPIEEDGRPLA